jgi:hypothetical protein
MRQRGAGLTADEADDAQLVCDEMAKRARHNVEAIVDRLIAAGYRFHSNDDEETPATPFLPATEAAEGQAAWLRERFGRVPMSLLSWLRLVGDVWLVGTHPAWADSAAADPLVIDLEGLRYPQSPIQAYFGRQYETWQRSATSDTESAGLFVLPMSPDALHKDNTSGGPPFGVILPDGCVDGLWAGETTMPFVSYLNWVFANGGFPKHASFSHQAWQVRRSLAADLLPL